MAKTLHKSTKRPRKRRNPVVEVSAEHDNVGAASVTYQRELVTCGKLACKKCRGNVGRGHGPYWFAYWTTGNKTRSLYIGKERRAAARVVVELAERKAERKREQAAKLRRVTRASKR
jgi:hypothetical protein